MGLKAKAGSDIAPVEAGTWTAVCVGYADLGTQHGEYQGQETVGQKVMIFWDLPDQRMEYQGEDVPRRISKRYGLSLGKKANLRRDLNSWRGRAFTEDELRGFDLSQLIGTGCQLSIVHANKVSGGVYANVETVMAMRKGDPKPKMETPIIQYEIKVDGVFVEPPESLPEWVRKIISESDEYKAAHGIVDKDRESVDKGQSAPAPKDGPDDVPF